MLTKSIIFDSHFVIYSNKITLSNYHLIINIHLIEKKKFAGEKIACFLLIQLTFCTRDRFCLMANTISSADLINLIGRSFTEENNTERRVVDETLRNLQKQPNFSAALFVRILPFFRLFFN